MAYVSKISLCFVLLFVLVTTHASGLLINNVNIAQVIVGGRIFCTVDGNPMSGGGSTGLAGVDVFIVCNGSDTRTTVGQAVTDAAGFVQVVINLVDGIGFDGPQCTAVVELPVATCAILPPIGILEASLSLVSVVQTALGGVATFALGTLVAS